MGGKIILFSGYSGVGKSTVIKGLLKRSDKFSYIPSVTTRKKRTYLGEEEGNPYYFVDEDKFKEYIDRGSFLEYENVHGNYYGTLLDKYEEELAKGSYILKDIDVKGAMRFKEIYGEDAVTIYLFVEDDEEVRRRLMNRNEDVDDIDIRLERIAFEDSYRDRFDFNVKNEGDIEKIVHGIYWMLKGNNKLG